MTAEDRLRRLLLEELGRGDRRWADLRAAAESRGWKVPEIGGALRSLMADGAVRRLWSWSGPAIYRLHGPA